VCVCSALTPSPDTDSVVVGDLGYDVTCSCTIEGDAGEYPAERLESLGFEQGGYP
jgi:hypothetical protein